MGIGQWQTWTFICKGQHNAPSSDDYPAHCQDSGADDNSSRRRSMDGKLIFTTAFVLLTIIRLKCIAAVCGNNEQPA